MNDRPIFRSNLHLAEIHGQLELSTCTKLRQGQLLMHRYHHVYTMSRSTLYEPLGDECKRKSVILAKRMKAHAKECRVCKVNDELNNPNFYGLDMPAVYHPPGKHWWLRLPE